MFFNQVKFIFCVVSSALCMFAHTANAQEPIESTAMANSAPNDERIQENENSSNVVNVNPKSDQVYYEALPNMPAPAVKHRYSDAIRISAETGIGILLSAAFGTATAYVGVGEILSSFGGGESDTSSPKYAVAQAGMFMLGAGAIGGGVHLTGYLMDSQGSAWTPYVGSAVGMAAGVGLYYLSTLAESTEISLATYIIGWTLPVVGAVLGYELSDRANNKEAGVTWAPYANIAPDLRSGSVGVKIMF